MCVGARLHPIRLQVQRFKTRTSQECHDFLRPLRFVKTRLTWRSEVREKAKHTGCYFSAGKSPPEVKGNAASLVSFGFLATHGLSARVLAKLQRTHEGKGNAQKSNEELGDGAKPASSLQKAALWVFCFSRARCSPLSGSLGF